MPSTGDPSFLAATLIRRLHLKMRSHMLEAMHGAGFSDITGAQIYVLQSPGPDGARPTELARRTLMTKQAMNHLLAGLEAGGYLERRTADDDARARVLALTDRGWELVKVGQRAGAQLQRQWTDALGPARMKELLSTLTELDALAEAEG